jgi:tRNA threonylcarbamoyladenosine biosynthesis protein TsaE
MPVAHTHNPEETAALARRLAAHLQAGDLILLQGGLGAGKTTFVQGLAQGLGVREPVTSPTFTLIHHYSGGRLPLFHFDLYRLEGEQEIADLGFEEYLEQRGVIVVEWAERLGSLTPSEYLRVNITRSGENARAFDLQPFGTRYETTLSSALSGAFSENDPC